MAESAQDSTFTNRLASETSPYLLQHKNNPVDWYPWGEEALNKAKEEDKPIFLSIGYSACHWCHVMAHESFENPNIAAYLNEHFVNIKVDREERPDLDEIYMTATQLITHSGGWPMSVFLTPDLKPFYAGTYYPPEDMYNRPGFRRLIETLAETYEKRPDEVKTSSENVANAITEVLAADTSAATVEKTAVFRMVESMKQRFDPVWGGFGGAPKFPHTMDLMLAMRYYRENKDEEVLHMVTHSLEKMARGGMYDQLGGGFHRYSVDSEWLIPHFEKMLYDNALLSRTYLEAYQLTGNEFFAKIAREIFDYVIREMQDEEGGYYSATDADSEGEEGKFFVWTPGEVASVLGAEDATVVCTYYDVRDGSGNFEHGQSALWIPKDPENVAKDLGISLEELNQIIERSKPKLLQERSKRIPPGLDDKVLVDWNGLMISSMAFGSFVLSETRYFESASKAAGCLLAHQWDGERLLHSRRHGESRIEGMLSDYANLVMGLIDLYETTLDQRWLEKAAEIHAAMVERFGDSENGGYFNTVAGQSDLLIRTKTGTDNATPSGNSVAALNALRLGALTGKTEYDEQAKTTLLFFGQGLLSQGMAYPMMMNALDYHHHGGEELVLVPVPSQPLDPFLDPLRKRFDPYLVWVSAGKGIEELAPLVKGREPVDGKVTAYLCRNQTCQAPTTDPEEVLKQLE